MSPIQVFKKTALMNFIWLVLALVGLLKQHTFLGLIPFLISVCATLGLMWLAKIRGISRESKNSDAGS